MNKQKRPKRERVKAPLSIANYTTQILAGESVREIYDMLVLAGANDILFSHSNYNGRRVAFAVSFRIDTRFGLLTFQMPTDHVRVYERLGRSEIPAKLKTHTQAVNVSWRVINHWLRQQLAMIEVGLVTLEQVFLPYAQDASGRTVYEAFCEKRFSGLLKDREPAK